MTIEEEKESRKGFFEYLGSIAEVRPTAADKLTKE